MRQGNDYFFARKRENFFLGVFFARKREKKKKWCFLVFLCFWGGVFCSFGVFFFVFRALARIFFGFIFRDEPSKPGNFSPACSKLTCGNCLAFFSLTFWTRVAITEAGLAKRSRPRSRRPPASQDARTRVGRSGP